MKRAISRWSIDLAFAALASSILVSGVLTNARVSAQARPAREATFTKDIAPILQRSCQECHRPDGVAPMPLLTYADARPYARSIKARTAARWQRGAMPPWFVEKNIGIQDFKNDPSLNDEEVATIARWVDSGAPQGDPADMPAPRHFESSDKWTIGEPDLVLKSVEITVPAVGPDKWTDLGLIPSGLTESRYASAVEVREVNDVPAGNNSNTVGGRFVFHHMTYSSVVPGDNSAEAVVDEGPTSWPIHEVGRNADVFPPESGRLLAAGSSLSLGAGHIHSNGRLTKSHLEFAFKFFPKGYKPLYKRASMSIGNSIDIDARPNQANQELHAYGVLQENTKIVTFEPHMHAAGVRMCLEAIWGDDIQTLNCVGYDHNWVKQYVYADNAAPLLPKGTIVHLIGTLDTTAANKNMADVRNWSGDGRRSISQMFSNLGYAVSLSDADFQNEMAKRRANMKSRNQYDIGCPLCWAPPVPPRPITTSGQGQQ